MTGPEEVLLDPSLPADGGDPLLARLRRLAAEADPPPAHVLEAARSAYALRDLDAELAALVLDSAEAGLAGVRGDDEVRLLSYESTGLGLELQVTERGDRRDVVGQVLDGDGGPVVVQTEDAAHEVAPGADGVFAVPGLPPGRLRVRLRGPGGTAVVTPWTSV